MMNRLFRIGLIAPLLVFQFALSAQTTWRRSYGGFGSDNARAVKPIPDGGLIVVGSTGSFGSNGDIYVLRLNPLGEVQWSRVIGGPGVEEAFDAVVLEDGFAIAGSTTSSGNGGFDGYLVRLNEDGNVMWERTYGTPDWDFIRAIDADENGLFMAGTSFGDLSRGGEFWVLRTDLDGNEVWSVLVGGDLDDEGNSVHSTSDGGCVIVGTSGSSGGTTDALLVKLDLLGEEQFRTIVGTDSSETGNSVDVTQDGSFVITGSTNGYQSYDQILVARVSSTGVVENLEALGVGREWSGASIEERPDGSLAIAATTSAFGWGETDFFLLFTTATCQYVFGTTYGGQRKERAFDVELLPDGGYVLAGYTDTFGPGPRAIFVVRTDSSGFTQSEIVNGYFDPVSVRSINATSFPTLFPCPVVAGGSISVGDETSRFNYYRLFDLNGQIIESGNVRNGTILIPEELVGTFVLSVVNHRGEYFWFKTVVTRM